MWRDVARCGEVRLLLERSYQVEVVVRDVVVVVLDLAEGLGQG